MYSPVRFSSDLTVDNEYKFASTTLYVAARYLKKMSQLHPPDGSTLYTEARYTTVLNKVSQMHPPHMMGGVQKHEQRISFTVVTSTVARIATSHKRRMRSTVKRWPNFWKTQRRTQPTLDSTFRKSRCGNVSGSAKRNSHVVLNGP